MPKTTAKRTARKPAVGLIMGSQSDWATMRHAAETLEALGVPFEAINDRRAAPLQVYVAVRKSNYWAEGFACLSNEPQPAASHAGEARRNTSECGASLFGDEGHASPIGSAEFGGRCRRKECRSRD